LHYEKLVTLLGCGLDDPRFESC